MLIILIPVLRRPHRIVPLLQSIEETTTTIKYDVLFIASPSDREEIKELNNEGAPFIVMTDDYEGRGDYARKINFGYRQTTEPYIFLGADDLRFYPNWFEMASRRMVGRIGVVGTNDLGNPRVKAGQHSTHSLVSREYVDKYGTIDEKGKILYEGYSHCFVDDELIATARRRRAWVFAKDSIVEHNHPNWGKGIMDDVYESGIKNFQRDAQLFMARRRKFR
jgi:glycosyltransferase involved in cell wall biosynthesis